MDEFTGRATPGRRWSEGLHQALEAKEGSHARRPAVVIPLRRAQMRWWGMHLHLLMNSILDGDNGAEGHAGGASAVGSLERLEARTSAMLTTNPS